MNKYVIYFVIVLVALAVVLYFGFKTAEVVKEDNIKAKEEAQQQQQNYPEWDLNNPAARYK